MEKLPFYKTFPVPGPDEAQGFLLKIYDKQGRPHAYKCPGQKRQAWEIEQGKQPVFCDKYAWQRVKKCINKNIKRMATAIVIHNASNEIVMKYIYKNGYLYQEEITPIRFYRQNQWNLTFISKIA